MSVFWILVDLFRNRNLLMIDWGFRRRFLEKILLLLAVLLHTWRSPCRWILIPVLTLISGLWTLFHASLKLWILEKPECTDLPLRFSRTQSMRTSKMVWVATSVDLQWIHSKTILAHFHQSVRQHCYARFETCSLHDSNCLVLRFIKGKKMQKNITNGQIVRSNNLYMK